MLGRGVPFDVAMRFLNEDPWERLALIRERVPNILTQMLLRGAKRGRLHQLSRQRRALLIAQAAEAGIDVFRVFDCLNWVENMRGCHRCGRAAGKIIEGALCYTGDLLDPKRSKYSLDYYVKAARDLEKAGCHILGIKDMAGLLKPKAARLLVTALKDAIDLPIHFHTHDIGKSRRPR